MLNQKASNTTEHHYNEHTFHKRLINMTSITLSEQENSLLVKGLKHNINTMVSHKTIENIITETKHIIKQQERLNTPDFNANVTRELVTKEIRHNQRKQNQYSKQ